MTLLFSRSKKSIKESRLVQKNQSAFKVTLTSRFYRTFTQVCKSLELTFELTTFYISINFSTFFQIFKNESVQSLDTDLF